MLRVGIVGGGIGGLVLAQGLERIAREAGTTNALEVTVFERDVSPTFRRQGYRVTIHPSGSAWLENCLPPELWHKFQARSALWGGIRLVDEQLSPVIALPRSAQRVPSRSIDRMTLRQLLLEGLRDVRFGKTYAGHVESADGVTVRFEDGTQAEVDLLVGADGSQSRVRRARLPDQAELIDTGYRDLAGRIPLDASGRALLAELGLESLMLVAATSGETMVLIPQEFGSGAAEGLEDYLYWGLIARKERTPELERAASLEPGGQALATLAQELTRDWHPAFRQLVGSTDPAVLALLSFKASQKPSGWQTSRVTMLGDAVHSMCPMRGEGANTAIRDAGELTQRLRTVVRDGRALLPTVAEFETSMLDYGFKAVRTSDQTLRMHMAGTRTSRRVVLGALRGAFRAMSFLGVVPRAA